MGKRSLNKDEAKYINKNKKGMNSIKKECDKWKYGKVK